MNSNIFNISNEYLDLITTLEENEGELTPELEEALKINEEARDAKMEAYAYVIQQKNADIGLAKDEINRLRTLIKRDENIITRLKGVLIDTLRIFGLTNPKTGNLAHKLQHHNMFTRKNSSIDIKIEEFSADDQEKYAEFLDFAITSKLSRSQIQKILPILAEEDSEYTELEFVVTPNKTRIKEAIDAAFIIEDEAEREARVDLLDGLAQYKESTSITIR